MQICCHGNMLALSRGFGVWRKLLTLAVSQAERHQHALSKTLSLSLSLSLSFSLSLSCSAFLSLSLALKCIKPCKAIAPLPKKKSLWSQVHPSNQMAGLSTSWITCWMLDAAIVPKSIIGWPWMQHGYYWWKNNVALCLLLFQQGFSHVWCSYIHHCFDA